MRAIKLLSLGCGLIAILLKITADAQEIHYARRRKPGAHGFEPHAFGATVDSHEAHTDGVAVRVVLDRTVR
jgi:hypothetical protein